MNRQSIKTINRRALSAIRNLIGCHQSTAAEAVTIETTSPMTVGCHHQQLAHPPYPPHSPSVLPSRRITGLAVWSSGLKR